MKKKHKPGREGWLSIGNHRVWQKFMTDAPPTWRSHHHWACERGVDTWCVSVQASVSTATVQRTEQTAASSAAYRGRTSTVFVAHFASLSQGLGVQGTGYHAQYCCSPCHLGQFCYPAHLKSWAAIDQFYCEMTEPAIHDPKTRSHVSVILTI